MISCLLFLRGRLERSSAKSSHIGKNDYVHISASLNGSITTAETVMNSYILIRVTSYANKWRFMRWHKVFSSQQYKYRLLGVVYIAIFSCRNTSTVMDLRNWTSINSFCFEVITTGHYYRISLHKLLTLFA